MFVYEDIALINIISIILLGLFIFRINTKSRLNTLFFVKCLIISAYIFFATSMIFIDKKDIVSFYKITMIMGSITICIILRFYVELGLPKIKKLFKFFVYIPTLIAIIIVIFSKSSLFTSVMIGSFWKITPNFKQIFFLYWPFYLTSYGIVIYIILLKWKKGAKTNKDKKSSQIISITNLSFLSAIIVFDLIMPSFSFFKIPYLCPLFFSLYIGAIFFALIKYKFLSFNKKDIINDIFLNIHDIIIILNPDKTLIESNRNYWNRFIENSNTLIDMNFEQLIIPDDDFSLKFNELMTGKTQSFNNKITYINDNEKIITDSYVSRIIDKFDDFVGILIISKEVYGIKQFKKMYNITDRQFEIVQFAVEGLSNDEIGDKLNIAKRTVETHLFNIYNKIGIDSKLELIKLAKDFNFI
jgi:DNA-binding CsgD family transcriptional regulator